MTRLFLLCALALASFDAGAFRFSGRSPMNHGGTAVKGIVTPPPVAPPLAPEPEAGGGETLTLASAWLFYDGNDPASGSNYPEDRGTLNLGVASIAGSPSYTGTLGPAGSSADGGWTYNSQATSNGQRHYDDATATDQGNAWTLAALVQPWGNQSNHRMIDFSIDNSFGNAGAHIGLSGAVTVTFTTSSGLSVSGNALTQYDWYIVVATNGSNGETLDVWDFDSDVALDSATGAQDTTTPFGDTVDVGSARGASFWTGCQCNITQVVAWTSQKDAEEVRAALVAHHGF